jgi:uncharacterized Fe-S cluster protein YjdI
VPIESRTYTNGEVAILWRSKLCVHCGNCARGLPRVFRPSERPWIRPENATSRELVDQVAKCPSGALSMVPADEAQ